MENGDDKPVLLLTEGEKHHSNGTETKAPPEPKFMETGTANQPGQDFEAEFDFKHLTEEKRVYTEAASNNPVNEEKPAETVEEKPKPKTIAEYDIQRKKYEKQANRVRFTIDMFVAYSIWGIYGFDRDKYHMDEVEKAEFIEAFADYYEENGGTGFPPWVNIAIVMVVAIIGKGIKALKENKNLKKAAAELEQKRIEQKFIIEHPTPPAASTEQLPVTITTVQNTNQGPLNHAPAQPVVRTKDDLFPDIGKMRKCANEECKGDDGKKEHQFFVVKRNNPQQVYCSQKCNAHIRQVKKRLEKENAGKQ